MNIPALCFHVHDASVSRKPKFCGKTSTRGEFVIQHRHSYWVLLRDRRNYSHVFHCIMPKQRVRVLYECDKIHRVQQVTGKHVVSVSSVGILFRSENSETPHGLTVGHATEIQQKLLSINPAPARAVSRKEKRSDSWPIVICSALYEPALGQTGVISTATHFGDLAKSGG